MSNHDYRRRIYAEGFTLIELMVTLAIAAVLATLAAPSFQAMIIKSRLTGVGSQFTGHIFRARNEAISRNTCTVMCLSTTTETAVTTNGSGKVNGGPICANAGNDWQQGWIVFLKEDCVNGIQNKNSRPEQPEDYIVIKSSIGDSYNLLAQGGSPPTRFFFDASGRPGLGGAGRFDLEYAPDMTLTQNYGFNICVDSLGRTRNISWGQKCS
jgi:type IV fimbrial biogenesis protein FimT